MVPGTIGGLEKRFAKDIKNTITHLIQNPYANTIRYKKVRIAHPSVFPYSIHYYIDEKNTSLVVITAIVHNSRNPPFSQQRL